MLSSQTSVRSNGASQAQSSIIIAVMGPTGTGKSSFIKRLTGAQDIVIGHGISSATTKAESYIMIHEGQEVVLVDTPGFDDSSGLDEEVVEEILRWLQKSMGDGHYLSGVIYLHRIIDPRITGTARANMRLFRKLCGDDNLSNVALGTTFWTQMESHVGVERERQLLADPQFWKPMASQGSPAFRLDGRPAADLDVISRLAMNRDGFLMQAQEEMKAGMRFNQISAAMSMNLELADLEARLEESLNEERNRQQAILDSIEQRRLEELRMQQQIQEKAEKEAAERRAREAQQRKQQEEDSRTRAADEKLMREKVETAEQNLRNEQATAARLQYYVEYECRRYDTKRVCCSSCGYRLDLVMDGTWCYHCCHCNNDAWYHCLKCGDQCPNSAEHPLMQRRGVHRTFVTRLLS